MNKKVCTRCKIEKPLICFNKNKTKKDGLATECKECVNIYNKERRRHKPRDHKIYYIENIDKFRNYQLKKLYNISLDEYYQLVNLQNNKCKICQKFCENLNVDHCHKSLKIRGLLCQKCNRGLGHFDDDIFLLENAVNYLKGN